MRSVVIHPTQMHDVWTRHLEELCGSLHIEPTTHVQHLSSSMALYCQTHHPHGVASDDLKLLLARAFCATGEPESAQQVLNSMPIHRRHATRWLEILSELHHFPELLPYFSQGIIRPADWVGAQLDRMWVLDFSLLRLSEGDRHEMTLYRVIRMLVEKLASFWDATAGEGILGLKAVTTFQVESSSKQPSLTRPNDWLHYCTDLLNQLKPTHPWTSVPSILLLEA